MSGSFSLYFHLPFCQRKCDYCHFYVIPDKESHKTQYIKALHQEWQLRAPFLLDQKFTSIYFGGGTPALLGPQKISHILSWMNHLPQEITLEANPENVTQKGMEAFCQSGVNRVSLGVQSLDDHLLKTLSRQHNAKRAKQAVWETHQAGIHNISIDLMYDLPGQTLSSWKKTLREALSLPITHLSLYNLTLEPHTAFYKRRQSIKPKLPPEKLSLKMLELATQMIEGAGLERYEISAFAKEGYRSHHNVGYWTGRPFLGLGPSAYSYWQGSRFRNVANLSKYCKQLARGELPVDYIETLPAEAQIKEQLAVGLRMVEGYHYQELPKETLYSLAKLQDQGLLTMEENHLKLTPQGLLFYDSVASDLI